MNRLLPIPGEPFTRKTFFEETVDEIISSYNWE
jgi:hypothetical protein